MKRLGLLLAVVVVAGSALASAYAGTDAAARTICHKTRSAKNPYVKLQFSAKQLRAHTKHAADIVLPRNGPCPRTVLSPTAGGRAFPIALTGEMVALGQHRVTGDVADTADDDPPRLAAGVRVDRDDPRPELHARILPRRSGPRLAVASRRPTGWEASEKRA